jgi:hypothetical protein
MLFGLFRVCKLFNRAYIIKQIFLGVKSDKKNSFKWKEHIIIQNS